MRIRGFVSSLSAFLLFTAAASLPALAHESGKTHSHAAKVVKPESVGFSSAELKKFEQGMKGFVDKGQIAGLITIIARHGEVVEQKAYGYRDVEAKKPMQLDTIVRIYSMTKPIVGAAMMMLYEEGKWKPEDPIAKYIPEFANLKVYAGEKDGKPVLEELKHAPTMGELMSHNAGFTYGNFGNTPVDKMYLAADPLGAPSLQTFIERMAKLPLLYQPGEKWVYSVSVDIQGYLVQKLSGKTFPEFLQERIFAPLGMSDTGFFVPENKLSRVAKIYAWDRTKNGLILAPPGPIFIQPTDPSTTKMPGLPSGGGGLFSTAHDYLRFAQMMANGGELDGARILKMSSVVMARTNKLNETTLNSKSGIGFARIAPGAGISPAQGFGYDFAVVNDPAALNVAVGKGTFWWWGVAGTWFWIDPANDTIFIGIIQRGGGPSDHEVYSRKAVYDALTNRDK